MGMGGGLTYSPPEVDRIWGIWGSYYNILKAIFYLLKGDYKACWTTAYFNAAQEHWPMLASPGISKIQALKSLHKPWGLGFRALTKLTAKLLVSGFPDDRLGGFEAHPSPVALAVVQDTLCQTMTQLGGQRKNMSKYIHGDIPYDAYALCWL